VVLSNDDPDADAGGDIEAQQWELITFSAADSFDPDGDDLEFKWEFGDGNFTDWISEAEVFHLYTVPGQYLVQLEISDGISISYDSLIVVVHEPTEPVAENNPPVAIAIAQKLYYTFNEEVVLIGSRSYDPDEDELNYEWYSDLDGLIGRTATVQTFLSIGNHTIVLVVIDADGSIDNDTIKIEVVSIDETGDFDRDGFDDDIDAFPYDPQEWKDIDGDGVGDNSDDFPTDPAASIDFDEDGYPDIWNPGKSKEDSTIGLELDSFPYNKDRHEEVEEKNDSIFLTVLFLLLMLLFMLMTLILYVQNRRITRDTRMIRKFKREISDEDNINTNSMSQSRRIELLRNKRDDNRITPKTYDEIEEMIIEMGKQ